MRFRTWRQAMAHAQMLAGPRGLGDPWRRRYRVRRLRGWEAFPAYLGPGKPRLWVVERVGPLMLDTSVVGESFSCST